LNRKETRGGRDARVKRKRGNLEGLRRRPRAKVLEANAQALPFAMSSSELAQLEELRQKHLSFTSSHLIGLISSFASLAFLPSGSPLSPGRQPPSPTDRAPEPPRAHPQIVPSSLSALVPLRSRHGSCSWRQGSWTDMEPQAALSGPDDDRSRRFLGVGQPE
jgi:hypothetical protein